jgi:hypothetical protein
MAALRKLRVTHIFAHTDQLSPEFAQRLERIPGFTRLSADGAIVLYRFRGIE